jgi:hypothetical protein
VGSGWLTHRVKMTRLSLQVFEKTSYGLNWGVPRDITVRQLKSSKIEVSVQSGVIISGIDFSKVYCY